MIPTTWRTWHANVSNLFITEFISYKTKMHGNYEKNACKLTFKMSKNSLEIKELTADALVEHINSTRFILTRIKTGLRTEWWWISPTTKNILHTRKEKEELKDYNFIPSNDAMAQPKVKPLIFMVLCNTAESITVLSKKPLHCRIPPAVSILCNCLINSQLMSKPISLLFFFFSLSLTHSTLGAIMHFCKVKDLTVTEKKH